MAEGRVTHWFTFDPDAKTPGRRLALIIAMGTLAILAALWLFRDSGDAGEDARAPLQSPAPAPVATATPPAATDRSVSSMPISQLTLHGVSGFGENGAAIIAVGNTQRFVRTGRPVSTGIILTAVAGDHVLLDQNGVEVRLGFPEANGASVATPTAGSSPASRPGGSESATDYQLALRPYRPDGRLEGFRLESGSIPPAFAQAGLRAGDVVTSVGGTELEGPEDIERIPRELDTDRDVRIEFLRGNERQTATVPAR